MFVLIFISLMTCGVFPGNFCYCVFFNKDSYLNIFIVDFNIFQCKMVFMISWIAFVMKSTLSYNLRKKLFFFM